MQGYLEANIKFKSTVQYKYINVYVVNADNPSLNVRMSSYVKTTNLHEKFLFVYFV